MDGAEVPTSVPAPAPASAPASDASAPSAGERLRALGRVVEAALERFLPRAEHVAVAAIVVGVAYRVAAPFFMDLWADGNTYSAMGRALWRSGTLTMPYGDVTTWARAPPGPSHHYPPLYPAWLAAWYAAFGWGVWVTKAAGVAAAAVALVAVWLTTRDLFGANVALLATGIVAAEPHLVWVTGTGFSENLVLAFFAVTMWAILKGIRDARWMPIAGLAAGLAYLTRASVGYFFLVAGMGGFAWRFAYMRWAVFRNRHYLLAIAVFGAIVLAWSARNVHHFGYDRVDIPGPLHLLVPNWETSTYMSYVTGYALDRPAELASALGWKALFFAAALLVVLVPFAPEAWRALRRIRAEDESALWLSVALVYVIGWFIAALFYVNEGGSRWWLNHHRYVLIAHVPLAWAILRRAEPSRGAFRARYLLLVAALLVGGALVFAKPVEQPDIRAAEALDPLLAPGDEVGVAGNMVKYSFYAYLTNPESITVYGYSPDGTDRPDWIVSMDWWTTYEGYELVGTWSTPNRYGWETKANLWERADAPR